MYLGQSVLCQTQPRNSHTLTDRVHRSLGSWGQGYEGNVMVVLMFQLVEYPPLSLDLVNSHGRFRYQCNNSSLQNKRYGDHFSHQYYRI